MKTFIGLIELARKNSQLAAAVLLALLTAVNLGCQRSPDSQSALLRFSVPTGQNSVLAAMELGFVVVNVRAEGQPLYVRTFDFHDGQTPPNVRKTVEGDIILELQGVPGGAAFIQYLSVYKDTANGYDIFYYGDRAHNIVSGDNVVDIEAANFGQSAVQGEIAGRYLTADNQGPTGKVIMSFQPPAGKPKMAIEKTDMINGWFNFFVLDGSAALSYRLEGSATPLFDNITLASAGFADADMSNYRIKVVRPPAVMVDKDRIEQESETHYILGYFPAPGVTIPNLETNYQVCAMTGVTEGIPELYTDNTFSTPIGFSSGGGANMASIQAGTATATSYATQYATPTPACDVSNQEHMMFHHQKLRDHDGSSVLGMRGPFQNMQPLQDWDNGFVNSNFDGTSLISMNWKFLPGITANDVSGVQIFARQGHSDGGGGGHDQPCPERARQDGYSLAAVTSGIAESHSFSSVNGTPIGTDNFHDFNYMLCPFNDMANGRVFWEGVREDCVSGNCGNETHLGWSVAGNNMTISGADTISGKGGRAAKITGAPASPVTHTVLEHGNTGWSGGDEGAELMLMVVGSGPDSSTSCGTHQGQSISPGQVAFTRILKMESAPGKISIPKGTFADSLNHSNLSASGGAASFCYVQAVKVLHFNNVTVQSTRSLTADPFNYGLDGGGVIAMRINGSLNMQGGMISAEAKGFNNFSPTGKQGGGPWGDGSQTAVVVEDGSSNPMGGGVSTTDASSAGGGAGIRSGGSGSVAGGQFNSHGGSMRAIFGSAGGNVDILSTAQSGAAGGGSIFIVSQQIDVTGNSQIMANGDSTASTPGGGGGGTVNIFTHKVFDSLGNGSVLSLNVNGGNSVGGGGGGAGQAAALVCGDNSLIVGSQKGGNGVNNGDDNPDSIFQDSNNGFCNNN